MLIDDEVVSTEEPKVVDLKKQAYNKKYYAKHRESRAEQRRKAYRENPEMREAHKAASREYYRVTKPVREGGGIHGRGFNRPRVIVVEGQPILCRGATEAATSIGCAVQTLVKWAEEGITPPPTAKDGKGRRWYSDALIAFLRECVQTLKPRYPSRGAFKVKVWELWNQRQI